MARVEERSDGVVVRFEGWEPLFTGRNRLEVPFGAIRGVEVVENGLRGTRGARMGLLVTGFRKIGRWGLGVGLRQLVSVRRREPALRLVLDRGATGYDEVLVGLPDAAEVAAGLRAGRP
ncbi:MAG TPA: hypothetical protein VD903_02635 [Pseudonocardia sp.]|nr:hypothetical protein [Pseudonocardia sp.]